MTKSEKMKVTKVNCLPQTPPYLTLVFGWKDLTFPVQIPYPSCVRFKFSTL